MIKNPEIIKITNVLNKGNLKIPYYQRPYSWEKKNVNQLIDDLFYFMEQGKNDYRLGNLIIHNDSGELNIVDGQQRLTTLSILLYLLDKNSKNSLLNSTYDSDLSISKIKENKKIIEEKLANYDSTKKDKLRDFVLQKCEFIYIELDDLSAAFQLFDSQNARGKALESYDLLKAFHLREMNDDSEKDKLECVKNWEKYIDNQKLGTVLGNNLFRIRKWSNNKDAFYLDKNSIDEFKGISFNKIKEYPYLKSVLLNIHLVEDLSKNSLLNTLDYKVDFPFQINQIIINGKYFFKYVFHYSKLFDKLFKDKNSSFYKFYQEFTNYDGSWKQGDIYVKEMFQAVIIAYYDKFGEVGFDDASKELYKWAYQLRLKQSRVSYLSVNKFIRENNNRFEHIKSSNHPYDLLKKTTPKIHENTDKSKYKKIIEVFEK